MIDPAFDCAAAAEGLAGRAKKIGVVLGRHQVEQFRSFCAFLGQANRTINLTALRSPEQIMAGLFLDSLAIAPVLSRHLNLQASLKVVDVGSGAGVPGVPLHILYPKWNLTLIESIGKKAKFIEDLVKVLDLQETRVLAKRAEEVGRMPEFRDATDVCVARAVAPTATLIELCGPLVKPGGFMAFPKGADWEAEKDEAAAAAKALGSTFVEAYKVPAPIAADHFVVIYEKTTATRAGYPRRVGLAKTRPIGADKGPESPRGQKGRPR